MHERKLAAAATAAWIAWTASPAAAQVEVYNQGGLKISTGIAAALGGFTLRNVDFGVGNLNTDFRDFPDRKQNRTWYEGFIKPGVAAQLALGSTTLYAGLSYIYAASFGQGDGASGLAQNAIRSTTSNSPDHGAFEEYFVGWKSGSLLAGLGEDAIDLSVGRQGFLIGDGLVIGDGTLQGWGRAGWYLDPRVTFDNTAIMRFNPSSVAPVRGSAFHLSTRTNQHVMSNFDQAATSLVGLNLEFYQSGPARNGKTPDNWSLGFTYFKVYRADNDVGPLYAQQFSFNPCADCATGFGAGNALSANRDGLNVLNLRASGSFLPFDRDITFNGELVLQRNNRDFREVKAHAWYVEPGYRFSTLPWSPTAFYRYASFSGDDNPFDRTDRSYDPLFFAAGARGAGPGTWYLGEIYAQYMGSLSNINVHQMHLRASPLDTLNVGALFYRFKFDTPAQFGNPAIGRSAAMDEINLYAEWAPLPFLSVTPTFGWARPRNGFKEAAAAAVAANGQPADTPTDRNMILGQLVVGVKF